MDAKRKSRLQEDLLSLYLRLNGFFVTGFVVHSPAFGENLTEVDVLGVRFPGNKEPEREIGPDATLETSDQLVDLVICEAKSHGKQLRFNDALVDSPAPIATLLRWAGMFSDEEINALASKVQVALSASTPPSPHIPAVVGPRQTRVRGLLCSSETRNRHKGQPWFLSGADLFSYISKCLCPPVPRSECATAYDFGAWGAHEGIVRYFKERGAGDPGDMKQLYAFIEKST